MLILLTFNKELIKFADLLNRKSWMHMTVKYYGC